MQNTISLPPADDAQLVRKQQKPPQPIPSILCYRVMPYGLGQLSWLCLPPSNLYIPSLVTGRAWEAEKSLTSQQQLKHQHVSSIILILSTVLYRYKEENLLYPSQNQGKMWAVQYPSVRVVYSLILNSTLNTSWTVVFSMNRQLHGQRANSQAVTAANNVGDVYALLILILVIKFLKVEACFILFPHRAR